MGTRKLIVPREFTALNRFRWIVLRLPNAALQLKEKFLDDTRARVQDGKVNRTTRCHPQPTYI